MERCRLRAVSRILTSKRQSLESFRSHVESEQNDTTARSLGTLSSVSTLFPLVWKETQESWSVRIRKKGINFSGEITIISVFSDRVCSFKC